MRKSLLALAVVFASTLAIAQDFAEMDKSFMDAAFFPTDATFRTFAETDAEKAALEPKIRVLYSRPMKKDRVIFGELLKFGEAWRIGANESTEILFMTDVVFGGTKIAAGRYSLIAFPTEKEWTIKVNKQNDGWGNYSYDKSMDIASVSVPTQTSKEVIEALSITMYEKSKNVAHLKIGWDKTIVEVPITLK